MVKFLSTSGIADAINEIIREADKQVTLISPYLDIPHTLLQDLRLASKNGVKIRLIYGNKQGTENKEDLKDDIKTQLSHLSTLTLRYLDNLHAKCYFNENNMVISSMNLYEYSARKNREMGILINATDDKEVFNDAVREANAIIELATPKSLKGNMLVDGLKEIAKIIDSTTRGEAGYCIRCKTSINYDSNAPYCRDCYEVWAKYKNQDYEERFCHSCGEAYQTSKNKPLCYSCYRSQR